VNLGCEHRDRLVIAFERLREASVDRHRTVMLDVPREVDGRHAAPPQLALDDVAPGEGGVEAVALVGSHRLVRR
jgi:hypothetical protein